MKQKSFEEFLNRKTDGFSLTPKEGLWEAIEEQLVPEKRRRRALWLWIPAGLLIAGTLAYFSLQSPANMQVSVPGNATVTGKMNASDVSKKETLPPDGILAERKSVKENEKPRTSNNGSEGPAKVRHVGNSSFGIRMENPADMNPVLLAENNPAMAETDIKVSGERNPENLPERMESVTMSSDSSVADAENVKPADTSKKTNAAFNRPVPAIPDKHTFYIGMMLTPLQSNSVLGLSQSDPMALSAYNGRKATDKGSFGYGVGLNAGYEKNRHHFYAGLQYQSLGCRMLVRNLERKKTVISSAAAPKFMYVATDSFAVAGKDSGGTYVAGHFNYLSIPVGYTYRFVRKHNFSLGLTSNLSYNILLGSDALLYDAQSGYYVKKDTSNRDHLAKSNFMIASGLDFDFRLNPFLALTLRPQFGIMLNPVEKAAINTGLKYWGIGAGLKWYLK